MPEGMTPRRPIDQTNQYAMRRWCLDNTATSMIGQRQIVWLPAASLAGTSGGGMAVPQHGAFGIWLDHKR